MKVVTAEQMRRIDATAINERGIPGLVLMERAGLAVARAAFERFEPDTVAIVTGKGNNAGDGFVCARELHRMGVRVILYLLRPAGELRGDALAAYQQVPPEVRQIAQPATATLREELPQFDLIVDAIFGTGLSGPVEAPWSEAIAAINEAHVNVLSIDIPSGLPAEPVAGAFGPFIEASMTVTFGLPKLGLVLDPGVRAAGVVIIEDIGLPEDLLRDDAALTINLLTMEDMRARLPRRDPAGNKSTFGRVLILAGAEGMTGAAVMATRAAARSGAGLVFSAYPRSLGTIMESHLIEPVKIPLAGPEGWFTGQMAAEVIENTKRMNAVGLGPGLGQREATARFVREVIARTAAPLVIDADALNLLADDLALLGQRPAPTILTPHPGEAARLLGCEIANVERDRLGAFLELTRKNNTVVVHKGRQTVITAPDGQRYINPTGNSGLAKGGSGDVLTGLTAGLLAQGASARDAACLGVFLHGLAADIAAERFGMRAMLPTDVIESLGAAFLRLEKSGRPDQ